MDFSTYQENTIDSTTLYRLKNFQALWRGYHTRKKLLQETRAEFEAIFTEIEKKDFFKNNNGCSEELCISWRTKHLCVPNFLKAVDIMNFKTRISPCTNNGVVEYTKNKTTEEGSATNINSNNIDNNNSQGNSTSENCGATENYLENSAEINSQTLNNDDPHVKKVSDPYDGYSKMKVDIHKNIGACCEFVTQTEDILITDNHLSPKNELIINCSHGISPIEVSDVTVNSLNDEHHTVDNEKLHKRVVSDKYSNLESDERSSSPLQCSTPVSSSSRTLHAERTDTETQISNSKHTVNTENSSSGHDTTTKLNETSEKKSPLFTSVQPLPNNMRSVDPNNILTESWLTDKSFSVVGGDPVNVSDGTTSCFGSLEGLTNEMIYKQKEDLTLELLWIKQAIGSRKQYLEIKNERS